MRRPLLALSLFLGVGSVVGGDLPLDAAWVLLGLATVLLTLAWRAAPRAAGWALVAGAVGIGASLAAAERAEYDRAPLRRWVEASSPEKPVLLRGVAAADAWGSRDRLALLLDTESVRMDGQEHALRGRVRVNVGGEAWRPEIIEGDTVVVWTTLRLPRGFGDPSADDVAGRAFRAGIHASGYCKTPRLLEVRRSRLPRGLAAWVARARRWARGALVDATPGGPEQDVVRAMVLGDKASLDDETAEAFRIAGTYHVIAISGTQVALLALLLAMPLARLGVPLGARACCVTAAVGLYAVFVGGDMPVVRAAIMAAVLVAGRALDLDGDLANLLGLAALLILALRPSAVADPGFELSFGATLGLVVLSGPLLKGIPRLPFRADVALAASLAAQLALAPLLLVLFHRLAPAALILNLAAVPLSSAVLLAGLGTLAVTPLGLGLAPWAGDGAWLAAHALIASGRVVEGAPLLDARFPTPPPTAIAFHVAALVLLASGRHRRVALVAVGVGLAALLLGRPVDAARGRLTLEVVDVGQGDCLVVRSPLGRVWVVDAGGSFDRPFDFGETVVGPHLWDLGITRIDRLLLTHAHPDHVGGAPFLVRNFRVDEVWEGPAPLRDAIYTGLDLELRRLGAARRTVLRSVSGVWDGVGFVVLNPAPSGPPPVRTRNDDSLVVRLEWGGVRLLLTGDIEGAAERRIGPGAVTVLKVPHHGSRTSSTSAFLGAVSPRVAVVSVGYKSAFGHPHPEVVARYLRAGVPLFRTDRDGTVELSTDGRTVWIKTAHGGEYPVPLHPPGL